MYCLGKKTSYLLHTHEALLFRLIHLFMKMIGLLALISPKSHRCLPSHSVRGATTISWWPNVEIMSCKIINQIHKNQKNVFWLIFSGKPIKLTYIPIGLRAIYKAMFKSSNYWVALSWSIYALLFELEEEIHFDVFNLVVVEPQWNFWVT